MPTYVYVCILWVYTFCIFCDIVVLLQYSHILLRRKTTAELIVVELLSVESRKVELLLCTLRLPLNKSRWPVFLC